MIWKYACLWASMRRGVGGTNWFTFPTWMSSPCTILCPEKGTRKLISCCIWQWLAAGEGASNCARVHGAGRHQMVDWQPFCACASKPGSFCPQKPSAYASTSGVFWGNASEGPQSKGSLLEASDRNIPTPQNSAQRTAWPESLWFNLQTCMCPQLALRAVEKWQGIGRMSLQQGQLLSAAPLSASGPQQQRQGGTTVYKEVDVPCRHSDWGWARGEGVKVQEREDVSDVQGLEWDLKTTVCTWLLTTFRYATMSWCCTWFFTKFARPLLPSIKNNWVRSPLFES